MNLISFKENDLPFRELETIGLAAGGQLLLNVNDLKALLSGRRTGLMHLENLEAEGIHGLDLYAFRFQVFQVHEARPSS